MLGTQYSVLIQKKLRTDNSGWGFILPFTTELWIASGVTLLLIAVTATAIQGTSRKFDGSTASAWVRLFVQSLYHGMAALLDGDDMTWNGWHGKIARIAVLTFALISLSSYTASLTAFFTQRLFTLVGPLTMADLASETVCTSSLAMINIAGEVINPSTTIVAPPEIFQQSGALGAWQWCATQLENGAATSMYGSESEMNIFLLDYDGCSRFGFSPKLKGVQTVESKFLVGNRTSLSVQHEIANNITIGLSQFKKDQDYFKMVNKWTRKGEICKNEDRDDQVEEARLKISHLAGLYVLVYSMMGVAIIGVVVERALGLKEVKEDEEEREEEQHKKGDGKKTDEVPDDVHPGANNGIDSIGCTGLECSEEVC